MEAHLLNQKIKPVAGNQLTDYSLIKWDNKNNDTIIGKARKFIWVAHNSKLNPKASAKELLNEFEQYFDAIRIAETNLYSQPDRHVKSDSNVQLENDLKNAIYAFQNRMPKVFDPFAGGGAIPLEAARLGCKSYGNDINPVAHVIQKGSLEFPQKYGKPIILSKEEFIRLYDEKKFLNIPNEYKIYTNGSPSFIQIPNKLSFDVEYYAKRLFSETESEIGALYPSDDLGRKPIAYYWSRIGICSNPSCNAEVPLLRGFYLANTKRKKVFLKPIIKDKTIEFTICEGEYDENKQPGWIKAANLTCPCCGSYTDVKKLREQFVNKRTTERLIAVISGGEKTKEYRIPTEKEIRAVSKIPEILERPTEKLPIEYTGKFPRPWGFTTWGDIYSNRQLLSIKILINKLNEFKKELNDDYGRSIITYLSFLIDKISVLITNLGRWDNTTEHGQSPFSRQAMAMTFDFPEYNPHHISQAQLDWILRYLNEESKNPFAVTLNHFSSGEKTQFEEKYLDAVVTDPPYYDAIPYADLSDIFYVWLKRSIGDLYPMVFATPQTPKTDECTALKHYHNGSINAANEHFENKLLQIFDAIEHQTSEIISIMFAHQSTQAWTTLCNSILGARMNITGSWSMDTELSNRPLALAKSALASSVTVSCKPSERHGTGNYREVKNAIEKRVAKEVEELYKLGYRGADLLTACFGQAVSEFGNYRNVEKADGSEVTVAELLEMARESAFNSLLKGFEGDDFTKFYIGWLQLYGFAESDFDDAAKFSRIGLSINVGDLFTEHILIKNGNKQTLGTYSDRLKADKNLGAKSNSHLIDLVHRGMYLFKGTNRGQLLAFIRENASSIDSTFWRVVTALDELLPKECDDQKLTRGLLVNKESLIRESKETNNYSVEQVKLDL
jgi:adenine-specific DNA methylase